MSINYHVSHDPARDHTTEPTRSEEHTSELQSLAYLVCRLLPGKRKRTTVESRLLGIGSSALALSAGDAAGGALTPRVVPHPRESAEQRTTVGALRPEHVRCGER